MKKALHSFPLKPLVIALAAAHSFAAVADPVDPISIIDNTWPTGNSFTIQTDTLTINSDASINSFGNALNNTQPTLLIDNNGNLSSEIGSAIYNSSTVDLLRNGQSGVITQNNSGLGSSSGVIYNVNGATITTLENSGTITSSNNYGPIFMQNRATILNYGTITTLTNKEDGTISGAGGAIVNNGTLTELNNAGTISATSNYFPFPGTGDAITNTGVLSSINNSGTIAGNITNTTSNELVINGGNNKRGSLIGSNQFIYAFSLPTSSVISSPIGSINSTDADVRFQKGQLLLNDNVFLGGTHTLTNNADVLVTQPLSINGNYHQTANAILNIGVAEGATAAGNTLDVGYGRLNVSGNALIDSGSTIRLTNTSSNYAFASGQRYLVISAGTATYNAGSLQYLAENYQGTVTAKVIDNSSTSDLAIYLDAPTTPTIPGVPTTPVTPTIPTIPVTPTVPTIPVTPAPPVAAKPLPTTGNAISSLNGLSGYSGFSAGLLDLFNASKTITTEAEANRVGEQLSPGQNSMASAATSAASMDALGVVGTHLDGLRITPGASARGIATGGDNLDWAAWGKPFYGSARQGMVDNVSGYRAHYGGLVLGADRQILDNWRAGAAVSYSRTSVKGQDNVKGSSSDVDAWGGIVYATYSGDPWFVNLSTSLTRQSYDSQRVVAFDGFNDSASAHFNGQQVALKSEFGYPLALGANTTLTPLASLSYSYLHQGSYQENSDNGSALDVDSAHSQSVESSLGGKLAHSWSTSAGDLSPFVQVMWTHQYDRSPMTTNSGFSADSLGETRFTSQGARQASDSADTSVGVSLAHADDLTLEARYDLQTAPQFMGQTVSLQVRKLF